MEKLIGQISDQYKEAASIIRELDDIMVNNPKEGIRRLPEFFGEIRAVLGKDQAFVEAVAGGPNPHWTGSILDVLGFVYPELTTELRQEALLICFSFLDKLNYLIAQDNVELIQEPWLVRDIIVSESWYWPGFQRYVDLLKKNKGVKEFQQTLNRERNGVWMAWTIIRREWAILPIRTWYYENFPDIVDRTLDAIAARIYSRAKNRQIRGRVSVRKSVKELLQKYDPSFYQTLSRKIKKKEWIEIKRPWQT
ncbi:MAG: hypothetical protein A3J76_03810 [Candidatus Moranbacteria bacterium RBG_13_45_13]|nr:MAG: hypothetical protein A3J76_03810 [Candidatus Moranbacteria bacterium RBG_13_45_13]